MPGVRRVASTWLPPLVWIALIFALSAQHGGGHLPAGRGRAAQARARGRVPRADAAARARPAPLRARRRRARRDGGGAGLRGGDEWHQSFVPGRTATARDVAIDGIGIALAALAATRTRLRERVA